MVQLNSRIEYLTRTAIRLIFAQKRIHMVLVIETTNLDAIHALYEVAKAHNVTFRVESDTTDVVLEEERQRRMNVLQMFKGGLKKFTTGYQPDKHEWYQQ
jgi:UV DNA damage repair endonuclease